MSTHPDTPDHEPDGDVPDDPSPSVAVEIHQPAPLPTAYMPVGAEWHAILQQADVLAQSDLVPSEYRRKPSNIVVAALAGRPFGWDATMAMRSFHIIEGQPSMKPEIMLALIRRAGHKVSGAKTGTGADIAASVTGTRADTGDTMTEEFTVQDAVNAGLCTIQNGRPFARSNSGKILSWEAWPKAMCWARAVSALGRSLFSDVVLGAGYTPEELGAWVDEQGDVIDVDSEEVPSWAQPTPPPATVDESTAERLRERANGLPKLARKVFRSQLAEREIGGFPASLLADKVVVVDALLDALDKRAEQGEWADGSDTSADPAESAESAESTGDGIEDAVIVCDVCGEGPCVCNAAHTNPGPDVVDRILDEVSALNAADLVGYPRDVLVDVCLSVGVDVDDSLGVNDLAALIVDAAAPFES